MTKSLSKSLIFLIVQFIFTKRWLMGWKELQLIQSVLLNHFPGSSCSSIVLPAVYESVHFLHFCQSCMLSIFILVNLIGQRWLLHWFFACLLSFNTFFHIWVDHLYFLFFERYLLMWLTLILIRTFWYYVDSKCANTQEHLDKNYRKILKLVHLTESRHHWKECFSR